MKKAINEIIISGLMSAGVNFNSRLAAIMEQDSAVCDAIMRCAEPVLERVTMCPNLLPAIKEKYPMLTINDVRLYIDQWGNPKLDISVKDFTYYVRSSERYHVSILTGCEWSKEKTEEFSSSRNVSGWENIAIGDFKDHFIEEYVLSSQALSQSRPYN